MLILFYNQSVRKFFFSPENLSQHWIVRRVIRRCKIFGRFPPPTEICDTDLCIIWCAFTSSWKEDIFDTDLCIIIIRCAFSSSWKEDISAADAGENLQKKSSVTSFYPKWKNPTFIVPRIVSRQMHCRQLAQIQFQSDQM